MTTTAPPTRERAATDRRTRPPRRLVDVFPHIVLAMAAIYFLLPLAWIAVASTKDTSTLFTSRPFELADPQFTTNVTELMAHHGGIFPRWLLNSLIYSGVGALASTAVCAFIGFAIAKYKFQGRKVLSNVILGAVMIPTTALVLPQYLLLAQMGLTNTYWAVILPSLASPVAVYLALIYAEASIPDELLEAARLDGAGEFRIVTRVAAPLMVPGLITVVIFQFVAIWNNYFLPLVVLNDEELFPVTLGLKAMVGLPTVTGSLPYDLVITGSLLSIVPILILFLSLQKYWRSGLTLGSVKA